MVNNNLLEVFRGRRILVTGDTGFKGSWLGLWLYQLGAQVCGYALSPEREDDHFNLLGLENLIKHVTADIRDLSSVLSVFEQFQPEIVFHLAAQPLVRYSYKEPKETFDTNVAGSVNILEAVRLCESVKVLVYVTSDKCYLNNEWIFGYRENDRLGGRDPYSASKAMAELLFTSYQDSFFDARPNFAAATVRAGNVIGGGDWAVDRIVPDTIRALKDGKIIQLRNPNSTRPWQHVLEPLLGYLLIAANMLEKSKEFSGAWNFGPDTHSICTVSDLVQMMVANWGSGDFEINSEMNAPYESKFLHLNCDKAHQLLGWYPKWNLSRAVSETVNWYRQMYSMDNIFEVSSRQILKYMESM